jgi:hypothetical protein
MQNQLGIAKLGAQTQTSIAGAQIRARLAEAQLPTGDLRMYSVLGGGNVEKGVETMLGLKAKYEKEANREVAYAKFSADLVKSGIPTISMAEFNAMYGEGFVTPTNKDTIRPSK